MKKEEAEVDFIARRYRKGRFSPDAGWRRLGIAPYSGWRRYRVAAAVAVAVLLSATAAILYRAYRINNDVPQPDAPVNIANPLTEVKVIDFENTPLQDVINKIETVYDIKVDKIPASPENYTLSLHYEGTPTDLISAINDILGTEMIIAEK